MPHAAHSDVPSILINSSPSAQGLDGHGQAVDDALLSPGAASSRPRASLDLSPSSSPTDVSYESIPSSPSTSEHSPSSAHFRTTIDLRNNEPRRKLSNATFTSASSDQEHLRVQTPHSHAQTTDSTSSTYIEQANSSIENATSEKEKKKSKKEKKEELERLQNLTAHEIELEQDQRIDPKPFELKPYQLARVVDPKSVDLLKSVGGTAGLLKCLGTNADHGLSKHALSTSGKGAGHGASHRHDTEKDGVKEKIPEITLTDPRGETISESGPAYAATLDDRIRVYGMNVIPTRPSKTLLQLMWMAIKDKVLVLLSLAAIISLVLGFVQDFGTPLPEGEAPVDWVEGVAIMVAVAIVVIVGSLNDWQKERQFKALNDKKEERKVKVVRHGMETLIDVKDVVVGDVALLEPGEVIPCDGIFLYGHNVRCDESGATGESDAIRKLPLEEYLEILHGKGGATGEAAHVDCFIVSGSKVLEGVGRYVVIAVGTKSFNGRIMTALRTDAENTPLQMKLNSLAELIAKIGSIVGGLLFVALMIRFFVQLGTKNPTRTPNEYGMAFVDILIISVTVIVVAVPEGLPLAVTLALAFATKRMTKENLLVRVLGSCETMANASVVCTDKTGTLTQNDMTVVAGSIGIHAKFVRHLKDNVERSNADEREQPGASSEVGAATATIQERKHRDDFSIDLAELNTVLPRALQSLTNEAIAVNSTAFEDEDPETKQLVFVGSKTETALLKFAKELGWNSFRETRDGAEIVQMIPFSSERKAMGTVVKLKNGKGYRFYAKGASEILSKKCRYHVVVKRPGSDPEKHAYDDEVEVKEMDSLAEDNIDRTIIFYANQTLRTIALCYRDFPTWPPVGMPHDEENEVPYENLAEELTLIGITGIEDPLRLGVRDAVAKCHKAGVKIKMCTGDNVLTARSIASQCGIFGPGGIVMEGPTFRELSQQERIAIVPQLQVLARSSPEDKKILVETLKSLGEIVGVTGDGTNDGPALKTANVGFSMGIAGTEVAKEASDIILMDDNFASIVKAIIWGRCVNDAVRKFLQFQVSTNVTAVVITFVTAVASEQEQSVLSAVQLLWINIIMDTFAALALATDPASEALLDRLPDKKTAPLFSVDMYKQILFQSIYQITVILIFHFLGMRILGIHHDTSSASVKHARAIVQTFVFNAFVFAQIFNSVNCRRLDKRLNIFEGIWRNGYFIVITLIEICVQVLIVFVGGDAFQVTRVGGREWGISLALGVVSIPLGALIRLMPNPPFEKLFNRLGLLGREPILPVTSPELEKNWTGAISVVRDNLKTFSSVRGGRVRSSSFVIKSRRARRSQESTPITISSIMTMVPTLVFGTVATGHTTGSLSDPAHADPSKSSAALYAGKIQFHPDTSPDDAMYKRFAGYKAELADMR